MSFIRIISCKEVRDVGRGLQVMFAKFSSLDLYRLVLLMYSASYENLYLRGALMIRIFKCPWLRSWGIWNIKIHVITENVIKKDLSIRTIICQSFLCQVVVASFVC